MNSIVDYLQHWASVQPDKLLYSFLEVDGTEREGYTYQAFEERTRQLAEHFSRLPGIKHGDRALLVYPPGLEVIVAFIACARAGIIPVPVYPPAPMTFEAGLAKLTFIACDCDAKFAFTTRGFVSSYRLLLAKRRISSAWLQPPPLPTLEWITTDDVRGRAADGFRDNVHPTLFLQYTSGSTADPKGVIVSQDNLVFNAHATLTHVPQAVSWLPQYHDMGLIGYYLFPLILGGSVHGFSPLNFLKRPALWLQTITKYRGTITSSPNFGFEYCLREDKFPDEDLEGLDLSSLSFMMNAAEPVRADTYTRFLERFEPCGLSRDAHVVAYGLAENTLCVSNWGRQIVTVTKHLLQQGTLHLENYQAQNNNQVRLVSCGLPLKGVEVRIVDPETSFALPEKQIGEIWLAGRSCAMGYWNRPELSRELFEARIANEPDNPRQYARTGDLGFIYEGEVYVCGRRKDLIIIRGVNYYPQDIEAIAEEAADPHVRKGGAVAFSVDAGGEALTVLAEVRNKDALPDAAAIARAIRTQYYVEPHTIAFVPKGSISKTTSGKTARSLTRQRWLNGELTVIASYVSARDQEPLGDVSGIRERFRYIVALYNLTGNEECTFGEIGIDSLTLVRLLDDVKVLLEEHGAGALVREVDVRLLQRLTIAEFFSLLDQFEKSAGEPIQVLRYVLKRVRDEHESFERDCMRADAQLGPQQIEVTQPAAPVGNMLVTGTTGFFGPFLLASLLRKTPYTFYALTRATDPLHGVDRIKSALRRSRILTPELEEALEKRVHVVCGNLARHNLGLSSEQWRSLSHKVQAVCHSGAIVNYVLNYDALRPTNVDGTREIIRFAFTGAPKQFHLVSSTFIYGWTPKPMLYETDNNQEMENLDFGYAQTKWVAEQLVLEAQKQGLDVRIYRPSLISAAANGVGSREDVLVRLLAFMIRYGIGVTARNQLSLLPVDITADNIASMIVQPDLPGRTLHVTVDDYYNFPDVLQTVSRLYGYEFSFRDIPAFMKELGRLATQEDPVYPLTDFFIRSQEKFEAMQKKRYSNTVYRQAREQIGGKREPSLDETMTYIVDHMLREGMIPPADELRRERAASSGQA
ncbi:MAG: thioester reductase domain-containing protein [Acidobacteria bacterium]|nr:thioester reductase domain-containing protein [Acidobacteriota bacterium]